MSWYGIHGHDEIAEQFRSSVSRGRLPSTFLFVGPQGIGKCTFAWQLAQALLCTTNPEASFTPCGQCDACQQVMARTHPDIIYICKPEEKTVIPLELLIGERDKRMREGLCHDISLKPFSGGRKVAIIDDADFLNEEGANCLLKTLEEPPPRSILILIGASEQTQLPTIRSRSQIIRFGRLRDEEVAQILQENQLLGEDFTGDVNEVAAAGRGSVAEALDSIDSTLGEFLREFLKPLTKANWPSTEMTKMAIEFVDQAGKEANKKRARVRYLLENLIHYYSDVMRILSGLPVASEGVTTAAARVTAQRWTGAAELATHCIQRCMDAQVHVQANIGPANLLTSFVNDLWLLERGRIAEVVVLEQ